MNNKIKKDAYYFPHFCNARSDRKIKRLIKEKGLEGYAIYFMLLEILREDKDFKYPLNDIDLLETEINSNSLNIEDVIKKYDLFQFDDEYFYSNNLTAYMQPYLEKKERASLAAKKRWNTNKEKNIIQEKPKKINQIINIPFDNFWNLYDKKVGDRNKIELKWNKLSDIERVSIMDYISKYKIAQPNKQYRKNPDTFLNNKSWNDEIITEQPVINTNYKPKF